MNPTSDYSKNALKSCSTFLNHHKEVIKDIVGAAAFILGFIECHDLVQQLRGRRVSNVKIIRTDNWIQIAQKVVLIAAKTSLILSGGVSRPGVFLISSIMGKIFSTEQLNDLFGPNTTFAVNPWHPRHVTSIAAAALALPQLVQSTYLSLIWISKRFRDHQKPVVEMNQTHQLAERNLRLKVFLIFMTSRPTLHVGNRLVRHFLRK